MGISELSISHFAYAGIIAQRKKGRLNDKRPKSREETPKEGSDSARRYRTATICGRAAQNARAFEAFPMQISHCVYANNTTVASKIPKILQ
jgi:hypothetical protein